VAAVTKITTELKLRLAESDLPNVNATKDGAPGRC
jgi:hypothetical protein